MSKKTVLITGCSSGFGKLAAKLFHKNGWNVAATMRTPGEETELIDLDGILVTSLDVTDADSVRNAVKLTVDTFGTVDVLVNNAGYGGHAVFEQFSEEKIYKMYETNVFGLMRTTREVLPILRKQKSGVVINITSMAGLTGIPLTSTYVSTKFAVEGFTESLAIEYKPFNVHVKSIAPGAYGTNFSAATDNDLESGDEELNNYALKVMAHFAELVKQMLTQSGKEADPQEVADLIYKCATEDMPVHNIVGADSEMLYNMKMSMPNQDFIDKISEMTIPQ